MASPLALWRHPLVVAAALGYATLRLVRAGLPGPLPALVTSYLADLLFMPLLLSLALTGHRLLLGRRECLPASWLAGAWLGVALWFEGLLPRWSAQAVADPLDVLAYALGTLAFHYCLNRPPG